MYEIKINGVDGYAKKIYTAKDYGMMNSDDIVKIKAVMPDGEILVISIPAVSRAEINKKEN